MSDYVVRKNLKSANRQEVDMPSVYRELDSGKTVSEVAKELGVSRMTLYRWHSQYQKKVADKILEEDLDNLPLPDLSDL